MSDAIARHGQVDQRGQPTNIHSAHSAFSLVLVALVLALAATHARAQERVLRWERTLEAPPDRVWEKIATEEGMESWMAPQIELDLRVGGRIRANYDPDAAPDAPSWIEHRILSYEPQRMLSFQTVDSPDGFEYAEQVEAGWGVMRLVPLEGGRTRFVVTSCGWGEGPAWDEAAAYFDRGNNFLLDQLEGQFEGTRDGTRDGEPDAEPKAEREAPPAGEEAFALLERMVGGAWVAWPEDAEPSGVRQTVRRGAGGRSLLLAAERVEAGGSTASASGLAWLDPEAGTLRYVVAEAGGHVAEGTIRRDGDALLWDWPTAGGERVLIRVAFSDDDAFEWSTIHPGDADAEGRAPVRFRRVSD